MVGPITVAANWDGMPMSASCDRRRLCHMEDAGVGENLRRLREGRGLSQAQLASAARAAGWAGALPGTILKLEKAQRSLRFLEAVALSTALECPLESLVVAGSEQRLDWARVGRLARELELAESEEARLDAEDASLKTKRDDARARRRDAQISYGLALRALVEMFPDGALEWLPGAEWLLDNDDVDLGPRLREVLQESRDRRQGLADS